MVRKKKSLLKDKRLKYGILVAGFIIVLVLFGSTAFSTFDTYKVGVGVTAKTMTVFGLDTELDEAAMLINGENLYLVLFGYSKDVESTTGVTTIVDGSVCELVCTDNGEVVGEGVGGKSVTRISDPDYPFYEIVPYFEIDLTNVYQNSHSYKLVVSGSTVGETIEFKIVGDVASPEYTDDGGGEVPILPEFVSKPDNSISMLSNETIELEWVVSDDNPATYSLHQNDTLIKTGVAYGDEFPFVATLENLDAGVYLYEFTFSDADGNEVTHTVTVTVGTTGWMEDPIIVIAIVIGALVLLGGGASTRRG